MSHQIPTDFWNPNKSKHYSQENGIDLDIYNYIIVYYSISNISIYIIYIEKNRYIAINASSYCLHVDSNQTPKTSAKSMGYLWPGYHSTGALRLPQKLRNIEGWAVEKNWVP